MGCGVRPSLRWGHSLLNSVSPPPRSVSLGCGTGVRHRSVVGECSWGRCAPLLLGAGAGGIRRKDDLIVSHGGT